MRAHEGTTFSSTTAASSVSGQRLVAERVLHLRHRPRHATPFGAPGCAWTSTHSCRREAWWSASIAPDGTTLYTLKAASYSDSSQDNVNITYTGERFQRVGRQHLELRFQDIAAQAPGTLNSWKRYKIAGGVSTDPGRRPVRMDTGRPAHRIEASRRFLRGRHRAPGRRRSMPRAGGHRVLGRCAPTSPPAQNEIGAIGQRLGHQLDTVKVPTRLASTISAGFTVGSNSHHVTGRFSVNR